MKCRRMRDNRGTHRHRELCLLMHYVRMCPPPLYRQVTGMNAHCQLHPKSNVILVTELYTLTLTPSYQHCCLLVVYWRTQTKLSTNSQLTYTVNTALINLTYTMQQDYNKSFSDDYNHCSCIIPHRPGPETNFISSRTVENRKHTRLVTSLSRHSGDGK